MRVCVFVSTRACACTPARVCTRADDARTHARRLADGPRARAQRRTASRRPSTSSTSPAGRHPTRNESQARVAQRRCRCTTCRSSRRGRAPARRRPSGAVAAVVAVAAIAPRRALDGCTLVRVRYLRRRTRRQNGRAQKRGVPTPIILLATVLQLRHLHVLTALHTRTQLGRRKLTHVVFAARAAPGLSKQTPAR